MEAQHNGSNSCGHGGRMGRQEEQLQARLFTGSCRKTPARTAHGLEVTGRNRKLYLPTISRTRKIGGQRNYSVWYYNDGYLSLCLSKSTEHTIPRMSPNINSRLWVTRICQCRFTDGNKCTTLAGVLILREVIHGGMMSILSAQFALNIKLP